MIEKIKLSPDPVDGGGYNKEMFESTGQYKYAPNEKKKNIDFVVDRLSLCPYYAENKEFGGSNTDDYYYESNLLNGPLSHIPEEIFRSVEFIDKIINANFVNAFLKAAVIGKIILSNKNKEDVFEDNGLLVRLLASTMPNEYFFDKDLSGKGDICLYQLLEEIMGFYVFHNGEKKHFNRAYFSEEVSKTQREVMDRRGIESMGARDYYISKLCDTDCIYKTKKDIYGNYERLDSVDALNEEVIENIFNQMKEVGIKVSEDKVKILLYKQYIKLTQYKSYPFKMDAVPSLEEIFQKEKDQLFSL